MAMEATLTPGMVLVLPYPTTATEALATALGLEQASLVVGGSMEVLVTQENHLAWE